METIVTDSDAILIHVDKQRALPLSIMKVTLLAALAEVAVFFLYNLLDPYSDIHTTKFATAPWFYLATIVAIFSGAAATVMQLNARPTIAISPEGLTVSNALIKIGPVRWSEIAEVRAIEFGNDSYVGIVPTDTENLCRRLGISVFWFIQLKFCYVPLQQLPDICRVICRVLIYPPAGYRLLKLLTTPIIISQEYLPISADELAERIRVYRLALQTV